MTNVDEIIELLKKWNDFKSLNPDKNIEEFGVWITSTNNAESTETGTPVIKSGKQLTVEYSSQTQFLASYFLNRMHKFIRIYTKNIFSGLGLTGSDDFSFLALIDKMDRPNKKELCRANLTEITTGLDIIRKLVKSGLAEELPDESDKRSKRLVITPKGKETVEKAYTQLRNLSEDILGDLGNEERAMLIQFLTRLNVYHGNIVKNFYR